MLLPVALNRHLVCIFCLLQNFTGSWTHNGKIKPWIKKRKKLFQNQTERGRKGCNRIQSKRSSSFREGKTTLHPSSKVICAFWEHVLWEQGLNIRPLSCSRMKSLGQVSSVTYLPSCCFLELILRRRESSPVAQMVKSLPVMQETQVWSLDQKESLEKGMATHPRILAWEIPWTEGPGGLSMGHTE